MAETLLAGDEPRTERRHHRAVVEHGPVEHLGGGSRRVVERDDLLDPPGVGLGQRQFLERDARVVERGLHPLQRGVVADLPADGDDLVGIAGHHDDARGALVHPQVQRVRDRVRSPRAKPSTSKANWRQRGRSVVWTLT